TTRVIFTGDWSQPVKEAEATNSLIDQGVDVVTCHVDGPKVVIETAEKRGIMSSGYHASQAALAPKGYLTGAEWDWSTPYKQLIGGAMDVGLLLVGAFVALIGKSPLEVYATIFEGGFASSFAWQNTLLRAAPLILTGLAVAIPAQAGLMVIGAEGALVLGGLATAAL